MAGAVHHKLDLVEMLHTQIKGALAGHASDGSRFLLRHEVFRPDGQLSARIPSAGGWMNLDERKLVVRPPLLLSTMNLLEKTGDFVVLPSSIRAHS